jgi:DNA-binding LytR/AlgR family response regulator
VKGLKYRIGICDDEKGTCSEIEEYVYRFFKSTNSECEVETWHTGKSCINEIRDKFQPDILFLDIELPDQNGISVAKYIRDTMKNDRMYLVFISYTTRYAMELFSVHPYDFLIKEITEKDIFLLLEKLCYALENERKYYVYQYRKNIHKVSYCDVEYFMSNNKHIEIHMKNGVVSEFVGKLKEEYAKLPKQFAVVAQSYVVNLKFVRDCYYDYLVMEDGTQIAISQPNRVEFRKRLLEYYERK